MLSRFVRLPGLVYVGEHETSQPSAGQATLGLRVRRITIPSGDLAYVDEGEGEGPPVLLLHGAPITSLGFVRVIRSLRGSHRVIAPDLPGFGQSRADARFGSSLPEYAKSLVDFCTALRLPPFVLFGCDAGALIGLAAAAKMASNIAGLVIADTVPFPLNGRAWLVKMTLRHVVTSRPARVLNRRLNLLPWLVATLDPFRRPFSAHERAVLTSQYDSHVKRDRILDLFSAMGHDDEFMRDTAAAVAALGGHAGPVALWTVRPRTVRGRRLAFPEDVSPFDGCDHPSGEALSYPCGRQRSCGRDEPLDWHDRDAARRSSKYPSLRSIAWSALSNVISA